MYCRTCISNCIKIFQYKIRITLYWVNLSSIPFYQGLKPFLNFWQSVVQENGNKYWNNVCFVVEMPPWSHIKISSSIHSLYPDQLFYIFNGNPGYVFFKIGKFESISLKSPQRSHLFHTRLKMYVFLEDLWNIFISPFQVQWWCLDTCDSQLPWIPVAAQF